MAKQAVILGGSISGMLMARVLSDTFDTVLILDKDRFPEQPRPRKYTPQDQHVHVLTKRGALILERLFPNLFDDLDTIPVRSEQVRWFHHDVWKLSLPSDMGTRVTTRPYLEWAMRNQIRKLPNVRITDSCEVTGLVVCGDRKQLQEVVFIDRSKTEQNVQADLVVDAMGIHSRTPIWLEQSGFPKPNEKRIKVDVGYASRLYRRPESHSNDWDVLSIFSNSRMGGVFPLEQKDVWLVTLSGCNGEHPGSDEHQFLQFAHDLPRSDIYEMMVRAESITPIATFRYGTYIRRYYEKMPRMPENLIVVGDALCSFNPIYGQGMSVSAMQAEWLGECLKQTRDLKTVCRRYYKRVSKLIDMVWLMSTSEDYRRLGDTSRVPAAIRMLNWYTGHLFHLCEVDRKVTYRFMEVQNLLRNPLSLWSPSILVRVLWFWLFGDKFYKGKDTSRVNQV